MRRFHNARHGNWWGVLDTLCHALHLPRWIQGPVCDRYEKTLGTFDPSKTWTTSSAVNAKVSWFKS